MKDLPNETRPLTYANERMLRGGAFDDTWKVKRPEVTIEPKIVRSGAYSKGTVVKIDVSPKAIKPTTAH